MRNARGFTLVELMISMLLGLVVIGGAMGVIFANRQSYRTNEGLSQVQESARTAFELLARDVRQAGVTGCDSNGRVANVVQTDPSQAASWWRNWFGIQGYTGTQVDPAVGFGSTGANNRINGTDSLQLQGLEGTGISIASHDSTAASFTLYTPTTAIATGDILMVCDFDHAAIFRVSQYASSGTLVQHLAPTGSYPRNCSTGLGYPSDCTTANIYRFPANSQLSRVASVDWYIGDNQRGALGEPGRSLYRRRMAGAPEEIVAGVTNMRITYRESGRSDFRDANLVDNWTNVNALMIELALQSADARVSSDATVNSGRIDRRFTSIVTLRNRVP